MSSDLQLYPNGCWPLLKLSRTSSCSTCQNTPSWVETGCVTLTQVCLCLKWMTGEQHIKPALDMPDVSGHNRGEQISWFLCPL